MKSCVMQLLVALRPGGAERLALSILEQGQGHFRGLVAGLYHPPGELVPMAEQLGLSTVALRAEGSSRFTAIVRLYRLLRREKVTLLHVQAAYLLPCALPAAWLARVPVLYTEHATHSLATMPKLRLFTKYTAYFVYKIICVSSELYDFFIHMGVGANKLTVIDNGVNLLTFTPEGDKETLPWANSPREDLFVFGTVGRLTQAKDHATLLRAFAKVSALYSNARLLLVGEGELRGETEALVHQLGLEHKVHMAGTCTNVPAQLRTMDAFVLSSSREGMPMAVLEAMACGLPVISTEVGSIASLNRGGHRVHLTPPKKPSGLAEAMQKIMEDKDYREQLRCNGRQCVLEQYSSQAMAEKYIHLYQETGGIQ